MPRPRFKPRPWQALYDHHWRAYSKRRLALFPWCVECKREGLPMNKHARASVTDHIRPHRGDVELFRDQKNHQSLCKRHHDEKTRTQDMPHLYPPGLKPAACRLVMVVGPPGSGKSTYVEEHKRPADRVIDLDAIASELSGLPLYHARRHEKDAALIERNHRLRDLAFMHPKACVWFIVSAPGDKRRWWEERLRPALVVPLMVPAAECVRRIRKDRRRKGFEAEHVEAVRYWWATELSTKHPHAP